MTGKVQAVIDRLEGKDRRVRVVRLLEYEGSLSAVDHMLARSKAEGLHVMGVGDLAYTIRITTIKDRRWKRLRAILRAVFS